VRRYNRLGREACRFPALPNFRTGCCPDRAGPIQHLVLDRRFCGLIILQYLVATAQQIAPLPYSDFQQLLREGKWAEVNVRIASSRVPSRSRYPQARPGLLTTRVDPEFARELQQYGVRYTGQIESTFLQDILSWILPVLLFFGLWMYLAKRFAEQGFGGVEGEPFGLAQAVPCLRGP
jgi:ATP-dependent Zn protease